MKKFWKLPTVVILCSILLFASTGAAFAGDKNPPPDPDSFITVKKTVSMPVPGSSEQSGGGISPDTVGNPAPGGGTLYAEIGVMYNATDIKGYGQSSLSSDVQLLWQLCAQVNYLKRNTTQVASASQTCSTIPQSGGGHWLRATGTVSGPYGYTWSVQTYHQFKQAGGWSWKPTVNFSVDL